MITNGCNVTACHLERSKVRRSSGVTFTACVCSAENAKAFIMLGGTPRYCKHTSTYNRRLSVHHSTMLFEACVPRASGPPPNSLGWQRREPLIGCNGARSPVFMTSPKLLAECGNTRGTALQVSRLKHPVHWCANIQPAILTVMFKQGLRGSPARLYCGDSRIPPVFMPCEHALPARGDVVLTHAFGHRSHPVGGSGPK
jgi:hypothetical protein